MKILNLGCGNQTFGTHRVDVNPTEATTDVFDVEKGIKFPDGMFDMIYSRNILEHLCNVGFHLDECYRVLKVGGKILITTDNAECFRYFWFGTHTGKYESKSEPNDRHYCLFTKNHLKNHFEKAGFKNIEVKYVKTDTSGRYFDILTLGLFGQPRIEVSAEK
jgi:predicted SAM-dependent methyltransferase